VSLYSLVFINIFILCINILRFYMYAFICMYLKTCKLCFLYTGVTHICHYYVVFRLASMLC